MPRRGVVFLLFAAACGSLRDARTDEPPGPAVPIDDAGTRDAASDDDVVEPRDGGQDAPAPIDECDASCPIEVVAKTSGPATLAVDDENVYFAATGNPKGVYQCPKTGCGGDPILLGSGLPEGIALAGGDVIWADHVQEKIFACTIGGCGDNPRIVTNSEGQVHGVWSDGERLFWVATDTPEGTGTTIRSCLAAGCTPKGISGMLPVVPTNLAVQRHGVLAFIAGANVRTCDETDCSLFGMLGTGTGFVSIRGTTAYWATAGSAPSIVACSVAGCANTPAKLGASPAPSMPIADDDHVYWRDTNNDSIYRCPVAGCGGDREVVATSQPLPVSAVVAVSLALDDAYVYWTSGNEVRRRHK